MELADTQDLGSCGASYAGSSPASPTTAPAPQTIVISQAVILAAGFGERLRPLTAQTPKPLLPLWGVPVIGRTIGALEGMGVRRIAVNLHWQAAQLRAYLEDWRGAAAITLSPEEEILGTGGALAPLAGWLGDDPFWLVNGDIAWVADLAPLAAALTRRNRIAAAWLMPRRGPQSVGYDRHGDITTYRSATPRAPGTATFCGVQAVLPQIRDYFPEKKHFSIVEAYERAQAAGRPVAGVRLPGSFWRDIGTPGDYLRAHGELKRLARRVPRAAAVYDAALDTFPPDAGTFCCDLTGGAARAPGSLLLPGGSVAAGGVRRCVVGGVAVRHRLSDVVAVAATRCGDAAVGHALAALGWRDAAAIFLGRRGSERRFWRLLPEHDGMPRAMVVAYARTRSENGRYAGHARLLAAAGVPVPAVLADLPQHDVVVLEDWGDDSLQRRMVRANANPLSLYRPVLAAAAALHTRVAAMALEKGVQLEPAFDAAVYRWEHELFERHLLVGRYKQPGIRDSVRAELDLVAQRLAGVRRVVVHRDFQSSNILFRGARIALIDFQGMRLGPAAYDLASLLCDPYVTMAERIRSQLLAEYAKLGAGELDDTIRLFSWAAVQRLTQALGAYGRLAGAGFPFARHIPAAAAMLRQQAEQCGLGKLAGEAALIIEREGAPARR